uniref:Secreted protein n=1 Tax=Steinernema glaseri TaxID=37863 RepID=A0A1I7XWK3_9BILA
MKLLLVSCALMATAIHSLPLGALVNHVPQAPYSKPPRRQLMFASDYDYYQPWGPQYDPEYFDGYGFKSGHFMGPWGEHIKDAVYKGLGWLNQAADKIFKKEENSASPAQEEADPVDQVAAPEKENEDGDDDEQSFKSGRFGDFGLSNEDEIPYPSAPITVKGESPQGSSFPTYGDRRGFKRGHFFGLNKIAEGVGKLLGSFL